MKETRNLLKINEDDSLGTIVVKSVAQGAIGTLGAYAGMIGAFIVIGKIHDMIDSDKEENELVENQVKTNKYKVGVTNPEGITFYMTVNAENREHALDKVSESMADDCSITDIGMV